MHREADSAEEKFNSQQTGETSVGINSDENVSGSAYLNDPISIGDEVEKLTTEIETLKDKYIRLVAEFDNFKKRNSRERLELIQTAGKDVIIPLLTVLDDCDRAEKQMQVSNDVNSIKEGVLLVFNKLRNSLQAKGLKPMQAVGTEFNPDNHEAITEVPTPDDSMRGKVIDEVEKGYFLNDKIIRFAKVVVGK